MMRFLRLLLEVLLLAAMLADVALLFWLLSMKVI